MSLPDVRGKSKESKSSIRSSHPNTHKGDNIYWPHRNIPANIYVPLPPKTKANISHSSTKPSSAKKSLMGFEKKEEKEEKRERDKSQPIMGGFQTPGKAPINSIKLFGFKRGNGDKDVVLPSSKQQIPGPPPMAHMQRRIHTQNSSPKGIEPNPASRPATTRIHIGGKHPFKEKDSKVMKSRLFTGNQRILKDLQKVNDKNIIQHILEVSKPPPLGKSHHKLNKSEIPSKVGLENDYGILISESANLSKKGGKGEKNNSFSFDSRHFNIATTTGGSSNNTTGTESTKYNNFIKTKRQDPNPMSASPASGKRTANTSYSDLNTSGGNNPNYHYRRLGIGTHSEKRQHKMRVSYSERHSKNTSLNTSFEDKHKSAKDSNMSALAVSNYKENCQVIVTKYSYYTKAGIVPSNPFKMNQDSFILAPKLGGIQNIHFFGVADGHGQFGREVSTSIRKNLPSLLDKSMKDNSLHQSFTKSFAQANAEVAKVVPDIAFSGSTLTTILLKGQKYTTANVGDSRIIVCSVVGGVLRGKGVTRDHKPDCADEAKRILSHNGRIEPFKDMNGEHVGPLRVWLKNEDIPGLAMTRSMGDATGCMAGVIAEPEIFDYTLTKDDKYIVVASDGIWEFMSNNDVAKIIWPFYEKNNAEGAADALVKEAHKRWIREEDIIDDITCVIIFLERVFVAQLFTYIYISSILEYAQYISNLYYILHINYYLSYNYI